MATGGGNESGRIGNGTRQSEGGQVSTTRIEIVVGDITQQEVDVIVNAANEELAGGGGVDGAIHRAAGPELMKASRRLAPCPPGDAVITEGYLLPARYVIHAVGPVWRGGNGAQTASEDGNPDNRSAEQGVAEQGAAGGGSTENHLVEDELLASCYRRAFTLAREHGARSIAFPAISTGVYGFPKERAARLALLEVKHESEREDALSRIVLVLHDEEHARLYRERAAEILSELPAGP